MIGTRERIGRWPKAEWKAEECETKMSATVPKTLKKPLKNRPLLETAGQSRGLMSAVCFPFFWNS